jgi:hypothetical protein
MESRFPDAIRLIRTSCTDRAQEAGFNAWYDEVHTPDVLSSGTVAHVIRYRNCDPDDSGPGYLAVHELTIRDFDAVARQVARTRRRLTAGGGFHSALAILRAESWSKIGREPVAPPPCVAAHVAGIFIVSSRCTVPEREQEFNAWYDDAHIPDLLSTGLFVSAYRFAAVAAGTLVGPEAPPEGAAHATDVAPSSAYLAIYETIVDPLEAAREFSRTHRSRLKAAGRLSEIIDVTWRGTYRQIASRAATSDPASSRSTPPS